MRKKMKGPKQSRNDLNANRPTLKEEQPGQRIRGVSTGKASTEKEKKE